MYAYTPKLYHLPLGLSVEGLSNHLQGFTKRSQILPTFSSYQVAESAFYLVTCFQMDFLQVRAGKDFHWLPGCNPCRPVSKKHSMLVQ